ncbi:hypothetical protein B0H67DRAFT_646866 [Lasiosphaeris hirsuta]|uniref:DUF7729 domain-containing protein n=1 Tax=Lasiosphaeris hirsuta TaxID=260670 RepID=A0AA40DPQ0_9PEZI|nr:hypothetical protein B0H67DRAFT_646866 [Lasiosphaeris hirsuta]
MASTLSGRRVQSPTFSHRKPTASWAVILVVLACLVCHTMAATAEAVEPVETLVMDSRTPLQEDGGWVMLSNDDLELRKMKRAPADPQVTTTFQIAVSTVTQASTTTTVAASPLPSPLDGGLSSNFTSDEEGKTPCPGFINSFLTDPLFKQCYPLSILLQGSRSFFNAEKSLVSITQVLDASCAPNATFCNNYMSDLSKNLTKPENCGNDFALGNSIVRDAYMAMVAYAPLYSVGCLKDPATSMYCYANAITNLSNPSNVYFYYLPLNISLPGSTVPSCSSCLQQTMNVFQAATANRKQPIANTYGSAASQVNTICGPAFVNQTLVSELVVGAGLRSRPLTWTAAMVPLLAVLPWLL